MDRREQQRVLQQLETVFEQSHRLQLDLLGLLRSMMEIEPPASISTLSDARSIPVDLDLPDKPMFSVEEVAAILGVGRGRIDPWVDVRPKAAWQIAAALFPPRLSR